MNISYGVILFYLNDEEKKILMINRKDSLCYIDFMRGKYKLDNLDYIKILLSRMSVDEINNIKTKSFNELWRSLWNIKSKTFPMKKDYRTSEKKFNKIKTIKNIFDIVGYNDSEWEFPKGKKNINETNKEAACRELEEETNIKNTDYEIIENIIPINETIIGENNVIYKNIYYIGICISKNNIFINENNKDQINEIKQVKLFTKKQASDSLRDYNSEKLNIINKTFNLINNIGFEIK